MGQARAGLVDGLDITELLQFLRAQLGFVEFPEQLPQQIEMPGQRRAERLPGKDGERQPAMAELVALAIAPAGDAIAVLRMPLAAIHPGQADHVLQRLGEKPLRLVFPLQGVSQFVQPALEGQAERQQVAGKEHAEPGKAEARIPGPGQQQQRRRQHHQGIHERLDIAGLQQQHGGDAARHQHRQQEEDKGAVDEIDHFRRALAFMLNRHDGHRRQQQGQQVFGKKTEFAGQGDGAGQRLRHQCDEQHADQVSQHQQVEDPGAPSAEEEHLAADDAGQCHDPEYQQPVVGQHQGGQHHPADCGQPQAAQAHFRPNERLPQDEQADMPGQQGAADPAVDPLQDQQMQQHQLAEQYPATLVLRQVGQLPGGAR